jgi:hypothetical protein
MWADPQRGVSSNNMYSHQPLCFCDIPIEGLAIHVGLVVDPSDPIRTPLTRHGEYASRGRRNTRVGR